MQDATQGELSPYLRDWFAPRALGELLAFRARIEGTAYPDLWRVVLSRAARSARLARHFDLDFPDEPVHGEYFCHKHRRTCRPVEEAGKFLRRYVRDAVARVLAFDDVRRSTAATVLHGDARVLDPPGPVDLVVTSPPYPGLIDYHEQHAYAFELLGLERRDEEEIGRGLAGYCEGVAEILGRAGEALGRGGRIVVVVNDRRGLYDGILADAGLRLEERTARHVNRRTGRRNGEYYEDVLVAVRTLGLDRFRAAAELLDLPLGRVELGDAEAVELLAALPEADRLLEVGPTALELGDDALELRAGLLEGELRALTGHSRVSSTRAASPPSASSTSIRVPGAAAPAERTIPASVRTMA